MKRLRLALLAIVLALQSTASHAQTLRQLTRSGATLGDSSLTFASDTVSSTATFATRAASIAQLRKALSKFAFDSLVVGSGPIRANGATILTSNLTYGGVTLSNAVTGTGNMVLSASPTFTGTITAAIATLSGLATFNAGATVASGQTLTVTGATITGLTAASVGAGTFPSGAFVFAGALSGITTLAGTGAVSGFTTINTSSDITAGGQLVSTGNTVVASGGGGKLVVGNAGTTNASQMNVIMTNATAPTGNPTSSVFLWANSGGLSIRGSGGGIVNIDNAGAVSGITTLAGTGAISGFTSIAMNGALTGATTGAFSSTVSIGGALTYGGVALSNAVTGTGNMVLSASPTLTGTLTAATVVPVQMHTGTGSGSFTSSAFSDLFQMAQPSVNLGQVYCDGNNNAMTFIASTSNASGNGFISTITASSPTLGSQVISLRSQLVVQFEQTSGSTQSCTWWYVRIA